MPIRSKTERLVCDAYIDLLDEKPFDRVRAKDLIERAGIGRSTFYDHFDSPAAVLELIENDIHDSFPDGACAALEEGIPDNVRAGAIQAACRHLQKNARVYRALCGPNGDYAFQARMERRNRQVMETLFSHGVSMRSKAEQQIAIQAMAGVQWYTLKWWAFHSDEVSVVELANMLDRIQRGIMSQL